MKSLLISVENEAEWDHDPQSLWKVFFQTSQQIFDNTFALLFVLFDYKNISGLQ